MAEKSRGMHFVFAYVKKKQYLCTRLRISDVKDEYTRDN